MFTMHRFTIVAPHVTNEGGASGYPAALRSALRSAGIDGWTEYETVGSWRGKRELGVTFEIYRENLDSEGLRLGYAQHLARIGRSVMPDQEAIQVTVDAHPTTLLEG